MEDFNGAQGNGGGSGNVDGDGKTAVVTVAIVDNDAIALYALRTIIGQIPFLKLAWEADSGWGALTRCVEDGERPDVLLIDMGLSDMPGPLLCRRIRGNGAEPPILAITSYPIELYAREAADAGAQGIIGKKDIAALCRAIRRVERGGVVEPAQVPGVRFDDAPSAFRRICGAPVEPAATLTYPETQVLNMSSQGLNLNEIAKRLHVKPVTARSHARHARIKLNARTLGEALVKWNQAKHR